MAEFDDVRGHKQVAWAIQQGMEDHEVYEETALAALRETNEIDWDELAFMLEKYDAKGDDSQGEIYSYVANASYSIMSVIGRVSNEPDIDYTLNEAVKGVYERLVTNTAGSFDLNEDYLMEHCGDDLSEALEQLQDFLVSQRSHEAFVRGNDEAYRLEGDAYAQVKEVIDELYSDGVFAAADELNFNILMEAHEKALAKLGERLSDEVGYEWGVLLNTGDTLLVTEQDVKEAYNAVGEYIDYEYVRDDILGAEELAEQIQGALSDENVVVATPEECFSVIHERIMEHLDGWCEGYAEEHGVEDIPVADMRQAYEEFMPDFIESDKYDGEIDDALRDAIDQAGYTAD